MIRSYRDRVTENLAKGEPGRKYSDIAKQAAIRLAVLDSAESLWDLSMPGYRLKKLLGGRKGQYSIRINDRYRICFEWREDGAHNVEVIDYH
jgi:toxin HigB-1